MIGVSRSIHRQFPCFALSERGYPPQAESSSGESSSGEDVQVIVFRLADFDRIGANLRQCSCISEIYHYQLCLYPAVILLFSGPVEVSLIEPLMLTPPNNFCSAPTECSHLSSVDENV